MPPKGWVFTFLGHGKFKLVMKKSGKGHRILLPNFCMNPDILNPVLELIFTQVTQAKD